MIIGPDGTATAIVTAVLPGPSEDSTGGGAEGNALAGTQLSLDTGISGIDFVVMLTMAVTDGADIESEEAFRPRMLLAYQNTPGWE